MSLMIVGADHLGNIKDNLKSIGVNDITHLSGRNKGVFQNFKLPVSIDAILVLTDYIHHTAMHVVKREAKEKNKDVIYARRSWACIYKKLEQRKLLT